VQLRGYSDVEGTSHFGSRPYADPEQQARLKIDELLGAAGWVLQDYCEIKNDIDEGLWDSLLVHTWEEPQTIPKDSPYAKALGVRIVWFGVNVSDWEGVVPMVGESRVKGLGCLSL
jgi:hypothetical protein